MPQRFVVVLSAQWAFSIFELNIYTDTAIQTRKNGLFRSQLFASHPCYLSFVFAIVMQRSKFRLDVTQISRSEYGLPASFMTSRHNHSHDTSVPQQRLLTQWQMRNYWIVASYRIHVLLFLCHSLLLSLLLFTRTLTGKGKIVPIDTMKAYVWVANFAHQPFYPSTQWTEGLGGPRADMDV